MKKKSKGAELEERLTHSKGGRRGARRLQKEERRQERKKRRKTHDVQYTGQYEEPNDGSLGDSLSLFLG
jgi:hypothetical protein